MSRKQAIPQLVEPEGESQEIAEEERGFGPDRGTSDETEVGERGVNKSQAARSAIDAGYDKPGKAVSYIKSQFGIDINPQHFSAIKSNYRKSQAGAKPAGKSGSSRGKPGRKALAASEGLAASPGLSDGGNLLDTLESLKPLIALHGADKLKRMVDLLG